MPGLPVVELLQIVQIVGISVATTVTLTGAVVAISKLLFVTKEEGKSFTATLQEMADTASEGMARIQRETSDALAKMRYDHLEAISAAKEEARRDLSKAVDERRKDVAAIDNMIRADLNEKFQAEVHRMIEAIKESKEERRAENGKIWDALDAIRGMLMKPRIPDTTAISRDHVR